MRSHGTENNNTNSKIRGSRVVRNQGRSRMWASKVVVTTAGRITRRTSVGRPQELVSSVGAWTMLSRIAPNCSSKATGLKTRTRGEYPSSSSSNRGNQYRNSRSGHLRTATIKQGQISSRTDLINKGGFTTSTVQTLKQRVMSLKVSYSFVGWKPRFYLIQVHTLFLVTFLCEED